MSVWTLLVERNRHLETHFGKPWQPPKGFEAHVMYGPPDCKQAWKQAKKFMVNSLSCEEPEYRLIGMMKGNFGTNFYSAHQMEDEDGE